MTPKPTQPSSLFDHELTVADRNPKTDRLILGRFLKDAAADNRFDDAECVEPHAILVKWADLEKSGRLAKLKETQLQGDFLAEVFGQALGYAGPTDGGDEPYNRHQHYEIAGQTPDAILGHFHPAQSAQEPLVVVELKGPKVHLDRDRSNGRTAVDQCWDYLNNTQPNCRWGIVSNVVSFRLYERNSTKRAYDHFTLQSLRDFETFKRFYVLFHRQGLIEGWLKGPPRAVALLAKSTERQREVSDKLYDDYSSRRMELISHLHFKLKHSPNDAIEMAQRLLDRIMFIAFCEDRQLLPEKTIPKAYSVAGFYAVTNPRWQNFKNLFRFVDAGNEEHGIPGYNGGLFAPHPVDQLELPDVPWTDFFRYISHYDFADEVSLDVLGHLFERSITELEKIKQTGILVGDQEKAEKFAKMPQSVKRKMLGIYYTPSELTSRIVQYTVEELIDGRFAALAIEHGVPEEKARRGVAPADAAYWRKCLDVLHNVKIVDPACGSGAFLFQAYNALEQRYFEVVGHLQQAKSPEARALFAQIPQDILTRNLYGVDLSPEAVEIAQLALWIRSATPGQTLATLSGNIVHGNSLVHDPAVHAAGFDWKDRFPDVFNRPESGFDCVIGNPPWERMDLSEREFFSVSAPEIATATTGAKRKRLLHDLKSSDPALFAHFEEVKATIDRQREYCRASGQYPLTGKGRTNCYAVFSELAFKLVAAHGRVGVLVPSGIAFDNTTKDFFTAVADSNRLIRLYDFENRKVYFPDVHASFKFCILNFGGEKLAENEADFVFFIHELEEIEVRKRHIPLSSSDLRLLNPNTRTCPIFRTRRDANITKAIYRRVPILIDLNRKGSTGNPWKLRFKQGLFNQTADSALFLEPAAMKQDGFKLDGNRWKKKKKVLLPLYEAKMFRPYDHRFGTVFEDASNWVNQGQTTETTAVQHMNPEYLVFPRWWIEETKVLEAIPAPPVALLAFRDITRSTDVRTFIASFLPFCGAINTAPIMLSEMTSRQQACLLGCLNSHILDYVAKQKTGHIHMNFFIVEQLPVLPPEAYAKPCPWERRTTLETWISERVLKLTCTAEDMLPLADACNFTGGSFKKEYGGRLNKWDEAERAELLAELDAAYFHLYGIDRDDAEYILSTFKGIHESRPLLADPSTTAQTILRKFAEMSFPA